MFVLLFGLMGVASIFPVGSYYMSEGEKFDFSSALAQNAFEEMGVRGMLQPDLWLYGTGEFDDDTVTGERQFIQPAGHPNPGRFNLELPRHPGYAFVLDPLNAPNSDEVHFPYKAHSSIPENPWAPGLTGNTWPVRRLTLDIDTDPTLFTIMPTNIAESVFRLRDDLSVDFPEKSDQPSVQLWTVDSTTNQLLTRQYRGSYSWLATVVPTTEEAILGLQPAEGVNSYRYDVSVVIFHRRDPTPSDDSERLIEVELSAGGELVLFDRNGNPGFVDTAVEDVRPGNWICLMGVNQSTGGFLMKWYRLLSLDDETDTGGSYGAERHAMIIGPNWPPNSLTNLRAAILPGAVSVVTRTMQLEND